MSCLSSSAISRRPSDCDKSDEHDHYHHWPLARRAVHNLCHCPTVTSEPRLCLCTEGAARGRHEQFEAEAIVRTSTQRTPPVQDRKMALRDRNPKPKTRSRLHDLQRSDALGDRDEEAAELGFVDDAAVVGVHDLRSPAVWRPGDAARGARDSEGVEC